ncbi:MAG: hypothetical protein LBE09_05810 [Christensenellaceae bacterium]|jgi:hypothetical protein|nr:hypothetical protein [Christensenellaceae bacterium]
MTTLQKSKIPKRVGIIKLLFVAILVCSTVITVSMSFSYSPDFNYYVPKLKNNVVNEIYPTGGYRYLMLSKQDIKIQYSSVGKIEYSPEEPYIFPSNADLKVAPGQVVAESQVLCVVNGEDYHANKTQRIIEIQEDDDFKKIFVQSIDAQYVRIEIPFARYGLLDIDNPNFTASITATSQNSFNSSHIEVRTNLTAKCYEAYLGGFTMLLMKGYSAQVTLQLVTHKAVLLLDKRCVVALDGNIATVRNVSWENGDIKIVDEKLNIVEELPWDFIVNNSECAGKYYMYYNGNDEWHLSD